MDHSEGGRSVESILGSHFGLGRAEPDHIEAPFWAAQAIAIGFANYRNAIKTGQPMRLGVAMELEGTRKDAKPRLIKEMIRLRDLNLAMVTGELRHRPRT